MRTIALPEIGTFDAWREQARALVSAGIPPEDIAWSCGEQANDLFSATANGGEEGSQNGDAKAPALAVPKAFVSLAGDVVWHGDPERFARLYQWLWFIARDRTRSRDSADPLHTRLQAMAKDVRRDKHKMTAFVRFREIDPLTENRRRFAAWFEPTHRIVEPTAPFFVRRFGDMDWTICTPTLTASLEGGKLRLEPGSTKPDLPADATEDLWRAYFRNIFNPARLKPDAMRAEMPKKYWRNLPEAELIPEMIATAQARAREMAAAAPTLPPVRAGRITERLKVTTEAPPPVGTRAEYEAALSGCRRCPLWENATQAVPGEGPLDAELMIVGEQPGDREDLAGRPFVGPAGQLFDAVAQEAGIDRSRAFITNAVKHFKFVPRGKRRLHQNPNAGEIDHCRWWLDMERNIVQPRLILAMGGTALQSLTGERKGILSRRGKMEEAADGTPLFVTVHPSYILRLPEQRLRDAERERFRADLQETARLLTKLAA
ncbi:UdgX family uracil-DNA binding protein [Tepidamorphus sp. 3E244]|uniref:UdgX family uracil-DNA binding protein n=1 Tax=Tepidamorphus sp. 3E244 TaxID=3385498 RepID=UPI0038FC4060